MPMAELMSNAYRLLTDDFTLYVFDRKKGPLNSPYTLKDMAEDTAEAIKELGLSNVSIFGASQGGMIGMEIAIFHPELVHKLILGSTSSHISEEVFSVFDNWIRLAKERNGKDLYLDFGEKVFPEDVFENIKGGFIQISKTVTEEDFSRFIVLAESLRDFDITDDLRKITCPTLVIGSKTDRVLGGKASEIIAANLKGSPDCELYMYEGYGHAAYDCAPDYTERLLKFLKK
jgi:pimeloyl-ACP methyl ester carboxylesterase